MLKIKIHFLLILSLGLFFACENEIELDFDEEDQSLAVFSLFTPHSLFQTSNFEVEVSSTQSILNNSDFNYIDDAVVTISASNPNSTNERSEETLFLRKGTDDIIRYETDETQAQDGFEYELKVEHKNYPTVIAKSFVPTATKVMNLEFSEFKKTRDNQLPGETGYFSKATIEIPNDPNVNNQFHLLVYLAYPINNSFREVQAINFDQNVLQEQLGADATIINEENSQVYFGAHFDDSEFSGDSHELNFDISFSLSENQNPNDLVVELRSVSKDYQNYFVEAFRLSEAGNNSFFGGSGNISNNIQNGYGVFAGYSTHNIIEPFRK